MDWEKISHLLDVVHKATGVPEATNIRNEALAALRILNAAAAPKPVAVAPVEEPELPIVNTSRRV